MSYVVFLIALFAVIMIAGIVALLRYQRKQKEKIFSDKVLFLKTYGKELKVNFEDCAIVHRSYLEDGENGGKIEKHVSIVTCHAENINDKKVFFKTLPVFLPEDELQKRLSKQKRTSVYYNPSDPSIYFFDVGFLQEFMTV